MTAVMGQVSDLAYRVPAVIDRRYRIPSDLSAIPQGSRQKCLRYEQADL